MARRRSTRSDAIVLTRAALIQSVAQMLTPLALVRLISPEEFGEYRLLWLVANTVALLLPLGMGRSLLYFLPKSSDEERGRYVSQTLFYFFATGLGVFTALVFAEFWLPDSIAFLTEPGWLLAAFTFLWFLSSPLQYLPNADQNISWQANIVILTSICRVVIVVSTAFVFKTINAVFLAMLVWSILNLCFLIYYTGTRYGGRLEAPTLSGLAAQFNYAAPFGLSQTIIGVRKQFEQWFVALVFSTVSLATFTIGASFNILLRYAQTTLSKVVLPKMSKSHAGGDTLRAIQLNNRANVAVFAAIAPTIAWMFIFAEPLISLLYTDQYVDAVPVLRVYLGAMAVKCVEMGSVLMILEQGRHMVKVNSMVLVGAAIVSVTGGLLFGLAGVAMGTLSGEIVARWLNFSRVSKMLELKISALQDWNTLLRLAASTVFAAIIVQLIILIVLADVNALVQMAVGFVIFMAAYVLIAYIFGLGWLARSLLGNGNWQADDHSC